jgi:hypothetical protein
MASGNTTMKRNLLLIAVCLMFSLNAGASGSKEKRITTTGWISDEACGAEHTKPGGENCVRKCLRGGAHVGHPEWKPQRMVFVTDAGKQIWIVSNPDSLKGFEGQHVQIKGQVNAAKKTLWVATAEGIKE